MASALVAKPAPPSEPEKQTQKAILKRIVDPIGPFVNYLQRQVDVQTCNRTPWLQPTMAGALKILPPQGYSTCPISSVTNKFVHSSQNRTRCAVNCVNWTPEGRRCMTGDNIGQITLWNSTDFKLEQMLQAHDKGVRYLTFTHNGTFLFSCDDLGTIRIFNPKLAPLQMVNAHQESCRAVTVSPADTKFASCSDDQTIKLWDLATTQTERVFTGHGSDVKFVDWHPSSSLLASGGRDGMIKLWDAREEPAGASITTLHGHKAPVNQVRWNLNGSWLLSTSRDQTVKVWDIRHTKRELRSWQGHTRDVYCAAWHPVHLELLVSGGGDGCLFFWMVGQSEHVCKVEGAHENNILGVAFHPNGHMLASCSIEALIKFWVRPRPGDPWRGALTSEQEEANTYAELLAAAATGAAAGAAPAATGAAAAPGGVLGVAAGGQLPGGISVQLPGLGGIPGIGAPAAAGAAGRPPGIGPPRPSAGGGPPHPPMAPPPPAAGLPPGLGGPPGVGGQLIGAAPAVPGLQPMQPAGFPAVPGLRPVLPGGASGAGMVPLPAMQHSGVMPGLHNQGSQQQHAGMKRHRDSDGDSYLGHGVQQQRQGMGYRGGRGYGGPGRGQGYVGHQYQQQSQQQHQNEGYGAGGRGGYGRGFGRGFAGRGDGGDGRGGGRAGSRGGFAARGQMRGGVAGRGGRGSYGDRRGH